MGGSRAFQLHTVSDVLTCGNGRNDEEYILVRAVDVKIVNYNMLFLLYCTYDCYTVPEYLMYSPTKR